MSELSGLLQQIGSLTEAVTTLKAEVKSLREEVQSLGEARAGVKFMFTVVGSLVAIGAGIAELVRFFVRHA